MRQNSNYAQLILCGGEGRRMAPAYSQKALAIFNGRPLIEHALDKQIPQNDAVLISCGPPHSESHSKAPQHAIQTVLDNSPIACKPLNDGSEQHLGPLAGILSGLEYCIQHRPDCQYLLVSPVDTPKQPPDLGLQLLNAVHAQGDQIIVSECRGRTHPLHSLWPVRAHHSLGRYLDRGERRVMGFIEHFGVQRLAFPDSEAFRNINSPEDLSS
ncbi:molybdenum cofactor guanylyltransferase [Pseudoteredinibacter isoporae]|uniref:Molybdenum cofactor guanylyltransferase n=1 Tax=Pseudoteredinibacter isoporae TaxID=570281 RepID=A0A7X0MWN8_9GAMM|nr:molybdenum cofactor guanylyltransferase [Pseudoteredinibacter isoporae]MBB6522916.1 molybdenum cofactor guanylyltransferase [Pseudoteredinibacter isoporae]NHO88442.1 molybdenum cofactor guanylyltransferase [Pseudoteredinibacter isoporae]NIB23227.1 molybdenum cofactor guanylyltransferase [Pseudoteredinibacter isoporae]